MRGPRVGAPQRLTRAAVDALAGDVVRPSPSPAGHLFDYPSSIIGGGRRDSDASSLASSRPSSAGGISSYTTVSAAPSDRASYLRAVNSYLSSFSPPIHLKPPFPRARDITDALRLLLSRLDFEHPLPDLNRDLPHLLASLRCPFKLSKSALKAPSTPHAWPSVLAVLHWLVQLARAADHLASNPSFHRRSTDDDVHSYIARAYSLFLSGDDSAVEELDAEYLDRIERHADLAIKAAEALEVEIVQSESKLQEVSAAPTRLEALQAERAALGEDVKKFQDDVDKFSRIVEEKKRDLAERERELEVKELEKKVLDEENHGLRERVRSQALSTRDLERMTREIQVVERDIAEGESRRNEMDEKAWKLNTEVERNYREIEALTEQCNHSIRKLKLQNHFQLVLNSKGSSAAEVIGVDYKTMLKPELTALAMEAKKGMFSNAEERINLQKQSHDNDMTIEGKKVQCDSLRAKIEEAESKVDLLRKETEDHASRCTTETEKTKKELVIREQQVSLLEREAKELLMNSEEKLRTTVKWSTEETQLCAQELWALIDGVSQYKEFMTSTISGIRKDVKEITDGVKQAHEASLQ
ncbi:hypothetical protein HPP92_025499 [Vanilla planifolia]|uniref:Kinetochore protein NDC80 n=1 Tax=Vanilla planifolia TaxID=51239 RepID=A0A835PI47_VANPL|nr:hypothetical protein HPP92_025499 [Vanilla planifolia]